MQATDQIIECLSTGESLHRIVDNEGQTEAAAYAKLFTDNGFTHRKTYDYCKVASAEYHFQKGNIKVDIVAANFLGRFVEIDIFKSA